VYTQCPECGTVFRVTAAVLRAAQGQVRCGVCDANFDSLRFLSDEVESEGEPPLTASAALAHESSAREAATPPRPAAAVEVPAVRTAPAAARAAPAVAPDEVNILEPGDVEDFVLADEPGDDADIPEEALEFNVPVEDWDTVFVPERDGPTGTPLDINLEAMTLGGSPDPPPDAEIVILAGEDEGPLAHADDFAGLKWTPPAPAATPAAEPPVAAEAPRLPLPVATAANTATAVPLAVPDGLVEEAWFDLKRHGPHDALPARVDTLAATREDDSVDDSETGVIERTSVEPDAGPGKFKAGARRYGLAAGTLVLALLLVVQAVHYWRDALADVPIVGPPLAALYARLGLVLEPRWDLGSYDVKQWGAASEAEAGALRLRASVVNQAHRSQPYPLLRVTLEDRFGAKVSRREFTPAEYLPGRTAPHQLLAPGARADADLKLADPGREAVGFELDVCLMHRGVLACGADLKSGGG
jgi:predicted Zn finger-like uncharacterized protein